MGQVKNSQAHSHHLEINDLIDGAIDNALARRELAAISDEEAARVGGGLTIEGDTKLAVQDPYIVAGFKPISPYCPPTKFPTKPICPQIVGLIYVPPENNTIADIK